MPQQPSSPPSPGLPWTLYSGMSSLQIRQPGAGHNVGVPSSASPASPPPKAVFKSSKAEHAHRPNRRDHRSSIVLGWDRHQAAVEAGRKRIMGDDAQFLASQYFWRPFPREMRAESQRETVHSLEALVNAFEKQKKNEEAMLDNVNDMHRRLDRTEATHARTSQMLQQVQQSQARAQSDIEEIILNLLRMSPNEQFTQICQNHLDTHYANRRRFEAQAQLQ